MPIFHSLPPREPSENRLLAAYHDGLRRHWGAVDRATARLFGLLGLGTGWSAAERRFLSAQIRAAGLSMADRRGVHRLLNPAGYPLSANMLRNKATFAKHAREHDLPVPATFDPADGDLGEWLRGRDAVIAKRGYSSKGKGVTAFSRHGEAWRTSDVQSLRGVLARHGVIQERAAAHETLSDLSPGVLPTLRIVTCLNEAGSPEVGAVVLRLGGGGARPVDNFNAGGIAVRVDESGVCVAGFRASGSSTEEIETHPVTGVTIKGRAVPHFAQAIEVGRRAHATLPPGYRVVGWDIGLSDRGPVLIEGNWNQGTDIVQLVSGQGLDRTRLGELYRFHLARLTDEDWRSARPIEW